MGHIGMTLRLATLPGKYQLKQQCSEHLSIPKSCKFYWVVVQISPRNSCKYTGDLLNTMLVTKHKSVNNLLKTVMQHYSQGLVTALLECTIDLAIPK